MITRREFIATSAAALAGSVAVPLSAQPAPADRKVLHIIAYSHIDAAWLWPWRDGANLALTTFRSALDRIKETPGFCYSHSSSEHYRWVQQADPKMFDDAERMTLQLTREMTQQINVSPATMKQARSLLPDAQVVELIGTIAGYNMVSRFAVATGLDIEELSPTEVGARK